MNLSLQALPAIEPKFEGKKLRRTAIGLAATAAVGGGGLVAVQHGLHEPVVDRFEQIIGRGDTAPPPEALQAYSQGELAQTHGAEPINPEFTGTGPLGVFRYYETKPDLSFREVQADEEFRAAEARIKRQFAALLQNRPDIVQQIRSLPNPINIHLYRGTSAFADGDCAQAAGCTRLEFEYYPSSGATPPEGIRFDIHYTLSNVPHSLDRPTDGFEVVSHELAHVLENLGSAEAGEWLDFRSEREDGTNDGFPAELTPEERTALQAAMDTEIPKIINGSSPVDPYALFADDEMTQRHVGYHEFWGVLTETFVEKPDELYTSNAELYNIVADFYNIDPRNENIFERPGLDELAEEIFTARG